MERRKHKGEYDQAAAISSLQSYVSQLSKSGIASVNLDSGKLLDSVGSDFTSKFKKTLKKMSKDAGMSMEDYFDDLEKTIEDGSEGLKNGISVLFDEIIETHEEESKKLALMNEKAKKHYLKHLSDRSFKQAADSFKDVTEAVKKGLSGQASASSVASTAFSKLSESRASLAAGLKTLPALGGNVGIALAGISAVAGVASVAMYDLSDKTANLYKTFGTNQDSLDRFTGQLVTMRAQTHLSTDALIELAESFTSLGMTTNNTEAFNDYIISAGKAVRITKINNEVVGEYIKLMKNEGASAKDVDISFDRLYRTMQTVSGTLEDFNDTISEGTQLFKNYGAVAGGSLEHLNEQILETKSLFKAMGLDAKLTGQILNQTFADSGIRGQRAMLLSSTMGGDFSSHYLDQTQNIAKASEDIISASLIRMQQQLGVNADALAMTPEQRRQKFGADQAYYLERQIEFAQKSTAAVAGIPQEMMNNIQVEYTTWLKEAQKDTDTWVKLQKAGSREVIKAFIEAKKAQQMSTEPSTGWQDAFDNANSTFAETTKELGRAFQSLGIILASTVLPVLNPLLKATNFVLDALVNVAGFVQPIIQWLVKVANPLNSISDATSKIVKDFKKLTDLLSEWTSGIGGISGLLKAVLLGPAFATLSGSTKEDSFFSKLLKGFEELWSDMMRALKTKFPWLFGGAGKSSGGSQPSPRVVQQTVRRTESQPSIENTISSAEPVIGQNGFAIPPEPIAYDSNGKVLKDFKFNLPPDARKLNPSSWGSQGIGPWTSGKGRRMNLPPGYTGNLAHLDTKRPVGYVSARGESGNPGIVNRDPNPSAGWDYGAWQFNANAGIPQSFVKWMKKHAPDLHGQLSPKLSSIHQGKGGAFGKAWQAVNAQDSKRFMQLQRAYAWDHYLGGVTKRLGPELGSVVNSDRGMQEMAFSTAIQHGVGGAAKILRKAGVGSLDKSKVIDNVYARRAQIYSRGAKRYEKEADTIQALSANQTPAVDMSETNNLLRQLLAHAERSSKNQGQMAEEMRRADLRHDPQAVDQLGKLGGGTV